VLSFRTLFLGRPRLGWYIVEMKKNVKNFFFKKKKKKNRFITIVYITTT